MTNVFFMFIAPFFAMFEVLNMTFGYGKEMAQECLPIIEADIAQYRIQRGLPPKKKKTV